MSSQARPQTTDYRVWDFVLNRSSNYDAPVFAEFKKLQRLNLVSIQNELAILKGDVHSTDTVSLDQKRLLRQLFREYAQAIQDYEYMGGLDALSLKGANQHQMSLTDSFPDIAKMNGAPYATRYLTLPSTLQQKSDAVREILRKYMHRRLTWTLEEKRARGPDYYQGKAPAIYSVSVDRLARLIMAIIGGAGVVVPMIVMIFHSSLNRSLITTAASVMLFAVFLTLGIHSSNLDTLVATATYAAVLVVFVGTTLPASR